MSTRGTPTIKLLLTSNRGHKHWQGIVTAVCVFVAVLLALLALHKYAKYTRTRVDKYARDVPRHEQLRRMSVQLNEFYEEQRRKHNTPLRTTDNKTRGFFGLCPRSGKISSDNWGRILNRRTRRRRQSISTVGTSIPLLQPSPPRSATGASTPWRPASARTVASSIGRRSASSPLNSPYQSLAPPLPIRPITPQTPHSLAILPPTAYRRTPATPRSATFARRPITSQTPRIQRSFSSPLSPTSTSVNIAPPLPTRPLGRRSNFEDSVRDYEGKMGRYENSREMNSPSSMWEVQKLHGGQ